MRNRVRADERLIIFPLLREADEYYFLSEKKWNCHGIAARFAVSLYSFPSPFLLPSLLLRSNEKDRRLFLITAHALIDFTIPDSRANRNTRTTNLRESRAFFLELRPEFFVCLKATASRRVDRHVWSVEGGLKGEARRGEGGRERSNPDQ